jgi:hypothetical protein
MIIFISYKYLMQSWSLIYNYYTKIDHEKFLKYFF